MSWFQDVVLWPGAEHLEGPSESSTHLLFAEKLYFGTEAPLGPGRHAVVDSVGGALLQSVHSDRLPWRNTEQQVEGHTPINWALVRCCWLTSFSPSPVSEQKHISTALQISSTGRQKDFKTTASMLHLFIKCFYLTCWQTFAYLRQQTHSNKTL